MKDYLTRNTYVAPRATQEVRDPSVCAEGYRLTVGGDGSVRIFYSDSVGLRHARQALEGLKRGEQLPVCELSDSPALPLRGIVEGFYGVPYGWNKRRDVIDFLADHRMNAYFYAPKDDPFHRDRWREPYPEKEMGELSALASYAEERGVRFYYCIAPGKDFRYADEGDYRTLSEKLRALSSRGVKDFAVLFDDIEPNLSAEEGKRFSSAAEAHCAVANLVNRSVPRAHELLFCPTDYFQNGDTPYRAAVRKFLDKDILVFWTGYNTVAEIITEADCAAAREAFGHRLVLWDNYPVNDYEPKRRVYFGEIEGRTRAVARYHEGIVANPSALWEASKPALCTMAEWMWDPEHYDGEGAYLRAVRECFGQSYDALFFAGLNRSSVMKKFGDRSRLFEQENFRLLDHSYARQRRAVSRMRRTLSPALKEEISPLLCYLETECDLYDAMRKHGDLSSLLEALEKCPQRSADQSLLAYIAKMGYGKDIVLPERPVYWETERK